MWSRDTMTAKTSYLNQTPDDAPTLFDRFIGITRAYAHRLQTHSCDDTCRCCLQCYAVPGIEICDRLCVHADEGGAR